MRGVQLLGIRTGAQELPQSCGLRAGRAEGMLHAGRIEPEQMPGRRGGGQRAGGAGGVEHLVVRAAQKLADTNADLVARHRGRQQLWPAGAERLGPRQRHRKDHRGRMEHRAVVHIVLLGHVRSRGVDHRREVRAAAPAPQQHLARARGGPRSTGERGNGLDRACAVARQGRTEPVDQQIFCAAHHGCGDVAEAQFGGEAGQRFGGHQIASAARSAAMSSSPRPSARRMVSLCSPTAGTASMR